MSAVYATEPAVTGKVILTTTHGPLEISLFARECPHTTKLFLQLLQDGYYDGAVFHRRLKDFMIQTGAVRVVGGGAAGAGAAGGRRPSNQGVAETIQDLSQWDHKNSSNQNSTSALYTKYSENIPSVQTSVDRRQYEVHSRLRFEHRGQVAMAMKVQPQSSSSSGDEPSSLLGQFFITLDAAPELNGEHVVFGTVRGPTFFNAQRIGNIDMAEDDDLLAAPRIRSVKIVENTMHTDLVATDTALVPWLQDSTAAADGSAKKDKKRKKNKRKGTFNTSVLSFGDELGREDHHHDVVEKKSSKKRVTATADAVERRKTVAEETVTTSSSKGGKKPPANGDDDHKKDVGNHPATTVNDRRRGSNNSLNHGIGDDGNYGDNINPRKEESAAMAPPRLKQGSVAEEPPKHTYASKAGDNHNDQARKGPSRDKAKRNETTATTTQNPGSQGGSISTSTSTSTDMNTNTDGLSILEQRRAKYVRNRHSKKTKGARQEDTMDKLLAFRTKVRTLTKKSKSGSSGDADAVTASNDDTLAARMARRAAAQEDGNDLEHHDGGTTYRGQVLDSDDDDDEDKDRGKNWIKTKFKCRRHMDLQAAGGSDLGGDGRGADDYRVIDDRSFGAEETSRSAQSGPDLKSSKKRKHRSHHGRTHDIQRGH